MALASRRKEIDLYTYGEVLLPHELGNLIFEYEADEARQIIDDLMRHIEEKKDTTSEILVYVYKRSDVEIEWFDARGRLRHWLAFDLNVLELQLLGDKYCEQCGGVKNCWGYYFFNPNAGQKEASHPSQFNRLCNIDELFQEILTSDRRVGIIEYRPTPDQGLAAYVDVKGLPHWNARKEGRYLKFSTLLLKTIFTIQNYYTSDEIMPDHDSVLSWIKISGVNVLFLFT